MNRDDNYFVEEKDFYFDDKIGFLEQVELPYLDQTASNSSNYIYYPENNEEVLFQDGTIPESQMVFNYNEDLSNYNETFCNVHQQNSVPVLTPNQYIPTNEDTTYLNRNTIIDLDVPREASVKAEELPQNIFYESNNNLYNYTQPSQDCIDLTPRKRGRPRTISSEEDNSLTVINKTLEKQLGSKNKFLSTIATQCAKSQLLLTKPKVAEDFKRKRGRPRTISSDDFYTKPEYSVFNYIKADMDNCTNMQELATSTPFRRRGRPKKSEQKEDASLILSEGRATKKRKVDYFAMANPEVEPKRKQRKVSETMTSNCDESNNNPDLEQSMRYLDSSLDSSSDQTLRDISSKVNFSCNSENGTSQPAEESFTKDLQSEEKCGECDAYVKDSEWDQHNLHQHYNLGWKIGGEKVVKRGVKAVNLLNKALTELGLLKCQNCQLDHKEAKAYLNHIKTCNGKIGSEVCICAVCNETVQKPCWAYHKARFHNNLTWRIGETPLDLNDQNLVLKILKNLYKMKKPLYCKHCGEKKKSVIGLLSHEKCCNKTTEEIQDLKVECKICQRKMLEVSLYSHMKLVHPTEKPAEATDKEQTPLSARRSAATKALEMINQLKTDTEIGTETQKYYVENPVWREHEFIKNLLEEELKKEVKLKCKFPDCNFEEGSLELFFDHLADCAKSSSSFFVCKQCLTINLTKPDAISHQKQIHKVRIIKKEDEDFTQTENKDCSDEEEDEDDTKGIKAHKTPNFKVKPSFLRSITKRPNSLFCYASNWTKEFCVNNYNKLSIYNNMKVPTSSFPLVHFNEIQNYLPKLSISCEVAFTTTKGITNEVITQDYNFERFELFETKVQNNGNVSIFVGGPVSSLAWMPTPFDRTDSRQILALSVLKDADEILYHNADNTQSSLIQFWDFGVLKNGQDPEEPSLALCLAHEYGAVWDMEWCPSGCYDVENPTRMGLLAVAGSDNYVYIYSVPFVEERGMFYGHKPVMKLQLELSHDGVLGNLHYYPTRISWTKASGHRYIAVGYNTGIVGLFDMQTESHLLKRRDFNNVTTLMPYKQFQAHQHTISALQLLHLDEDGNRWLITGSFDKAVNFWDLYNSRIVTTQRKSTVNDCDWLINWCGALIAGEESNILHNIANTMFKIVRDFYTESFGILNSGSTVMSVSASDWLNAVIHGNISGEIVAGAEWQLLYAADGRYSRKLFGYAKMLDKNLGARERLEMDRFSFQLKTKAVSDGAQPAAYKEAFCYSEAEKHYTLLFCDCKMDKYSDFPKEDQMSYKNNKFQVALPNVYNLNAITKLRFNPNNQASLYYATGYQSGFLRLCKLKYLEKDPQVAT